MRPIIRTRGNKNGQCNICGEIGPHNEDHSPPKSCVKPTAIEVRHIIGMLTDEKIEERGRISQNGLKFKTLCERCNNELLGLRYDPALAAFTERVSNILNASIQLPSQINILGNPQRIMRSVFGHLAAQGVERYLKGTETEALRDAFIDESLQLPDNLKFYYWPFPHHGCVVFRDAAYMDIPTKKIAVIWLMKFFPVSFLMSWEKTAEPMFNLPCLSKFKASPAEAEVELVINLKNIPHPYWPEAPSNTSAVTFGQEAMFAIPHVARGRKTDA